MSGENHEIVIIRRGGHGHEDGHHGGVWKIAFADFMTAMMAFFLVLWIVNSSSKETRASIARYFNPVKLSDTTPARKGLQTAKELDFDAAAGEAGKARKADEAECGNDTKTAAEPHGDPHGGHDKPAKAKRVECGTVAVAPRHRAEETLLQEPQAVLSDIVAEATGGTKVDDKAETATSDTLTRDAVPAGASGLDAEPVFVDPFEPLSPTLATKAASAGRAILRKQEPLGDAPSATGSVPPPQGASPGASPGLGETQVEPAPQSSAAADRSALREAIAEALKNEIASRDGPGIDIRTVPEGTLISLTDRLAFGMFAIGSAEPSPRAIAVMGRIAGVLARHPGAVVIRGHTDGRQYPSMRYDNWHLSADRAQMAWQMLLRGGLDKVRLARIEGHADRSLRNAGDPGAAENRRIEILLKAPS